MIFQTWQTEKNEEITCLKTVPIFLEKQWKVKINTSNNFVVNDVTDWYLFINILSCNNFSYQQAYYTCFKACFVRTLLMYLVIGLFFSCCVFVILSFKTKLKSLFKKKFQSIFSNVPVEFYHGLLDNLLISHHKIHCAQNWLVWEIQQIT